MLLFEVTMCMWKHLRIVIASVRDLNIYTYVLILKAKFASNFVFFGQMYKN